MCDRCDCPTANRRAPYRMADRRTTALDGTQRNHGIITAKSDAHQHSGPPRRQPLRRAGAAVRHRPRESGWGQAASRRRARDAAAARSRGRAPTRRSAARIPDTAELVRECTAAAERDAEEYLRGLARRFTALPPGTTTAVTTAPNAARAILDEAQRARADIIVVGSRGHDGVARALLGSVADKVVRGSSVPVLVCPAARGRPHGRSRRACASRAGPIQGWRTTAGLAATEPRTGIEIEMDVPRRSWLSTRI
jgi:nucleotide-binding universal stress UspA family protein